MPHRFRFPALALFFLSLLSMSMPLAERLRPQQLDDLVGQAHLSGADSLLRRALEHGHLPSMILWGPPGVGKTSIAQVIARVAGLPFYTLSAISSGVKDVREVIEKAKNETKAVLFIDEIHRFNKGQQDALLGAVEKGTITLIGATTENPSFEINAALLSRAQVYVLKSLDEEALQILVNKALSTDDAVKASGIVVKETEALFRLSGGDARKLYNLLELASDFISTQATKELTNELMMSLAQQKMALYDKTGEQHYDIISAFIKSLRGSDPNAALYWMARMIAGGEDLLFIARRMVVFAAEDIGNANPNALLMANTCFDATHKIGYPEARIILAQCVVYLATSVKSNASYMGIEKALALVQKTGDLPVPLHIRNAPTKLMKNLNYGKDYQYDHNHPDHFAKQEFLPDGIQGTTFYDPAQNAREEEVRKWLKGKWGEKYGY